MGNPSALAKHVAAYPAHPGTPSAPVSAVRQAPGSRYRVYFVGRDISVGDVKEVTADNDANAVAAAHDLMRAQVSQDYEGFTLIGPMAKVIATWRRPT